MSFEEKRI